MAKCNYPMDEGKREASEKKATVLAIVLALVPWAVGMPVAYRWPLVGLSVASILYLILSVVPMLRNNLDGVQKLFVGIVVLSLCVAVFWSPIHRQWKAERAAEVEGDIAISEGRATARVFSLGASSALFTFTPNPSDAAKNVEAMHILYDAGLRVEVKDGQVQISTTVRDRQGRRVALIDRNHWSVTSACLDKNYSSDSLEILDARGLVVFQMRLLPDHVELQGEWRDEFGNGVRLSLDEKTGGGNIYIWRNAEKEQELMHLIPPMFKYPSINHWGELS